MTESNPIVEAKASASPGDGDEIIATAGRWYRNARYTMAGIFFGCAVWFGYDGWIRWPEQNRQHDAALARGEKPAQARRDDLDIRLQKVLALSLPLCGIGVIGWLLYNSRGAYRLKDDVLYVPGHPPVTMDSIRQIDKSKWDKKGIAYIDYEILSPGGGEATTGTLKLDDFVYQQDPTDAILAAIEQRVVPQEEGGITA